MPDPDRPAAPLLLLRSYLTNDARFSVPAGWADRSITILTAPAPAGGTNGASNGDGSGDVGAGFSVTLHRDALAPGEDLAAYVERQLGQLRGAFAGFMVLRRGERAVGGLPGREVEFSWTAPHGRVRQHQVFVARDAGDGGGPRVLTWTASAPAPLYLNHVGEFKALLASVGFAAPAFADPTAEG